MRHDDARHGGVGGERGGHLRLLGQQGRGVRGRVRQQVLRHASSLSPLAPGRVRSYRG
ncbi:hypothetical protein Cus16_1492 [Curtobacterium sp. ER1/6]|nr:hypothetical protein Cus16_1492 [Curtobacterium sp. ER1/6]